MKKMILISIIMMSFMSFANDDMTEDNDYDCEKVVNRVVDVDTESVERQEAQKKTQKKKVNDE